MSEIPESPSSASTYFSTERTPINVQYNYETPPTTIAKMGKDGVCMNPCLPEELDYEDVHDIVHFITSELKSRDFDADILLNPLKARNVENLNLLLLHLFRLNKNVPEVDSQWASLSNADVLTLFQALKFIWCRLPNGAVIGWDSYTIFQVKEKKNKYPIHSFLEILPEVLTSFEHTSIVRDFFELIIAFTNKIGISANKIVNVFALWAFDYSEESHNENKNPLLYDSLSKGFDKWIPGADATFHLFLAFLKSYVSQGNKKTKLANLKCLEFLNDEYPPNSIRGSFINERLTIPMVTVKTGKYSDPLSLVETCNELLDFSNHEAFEAYEDYVILKSVFNKYLNDIEDIKRGLVDNSKSNLAFLSDETLNYQSGWVKKDHLSDEDELPDEIVVERIDIIDYFIWTWLASLSYEQTVMKRYLFGKTLILQFGFDQFTKWVAFQECDISVLNLLEKENIDIYKKPLLTPINELSKVESSTSAVSNDDIDDELSGIKQNKSTSPLSAISMLVHSLQSPSNSDISSSNSSKKNFKFRLFNNFKKGYQNLNSSSPHRKVIRRAADGSDINSQFLLRGTISEPSLISSSNVLFDVGRETVKPNTREGIQDSMFSESEESIESMIALKPPIMIGLKKDMVDEVTDKLKNSHLNSKIYPKKDSCSSREQNDETVFKFGSYMQDASSMVELEPILIGREESTDIFDEQNNNDINENRVISELDVTQIEVILPKEVNVTSSQSSPRFMYYNRYLTKCPSPLRTCDTIQLSPINTNVGVMNPAKNIKRRSVKPQPVPPIQFPDYNSQRVSQRYSSLNENILNKKGIFPALSKNKLKRTSILQRQRISRDEIPLFPITFEQGPKHVENDIQSKREENRRKLRSDINRGNFEQF